MADAKTRPQPTGSWMFKDLPRPFMNRVRMAAAAEGCTVKDFVLRQVEARIRELERRGMLPKGKG